VANGKAGRSKDAVARERIREWMRIHHMSQNRLARLIDRPQPWLSRYLKNTGESAELLETLARIAAVFGHSLSALVDSPADPAEAEVVTLYQNLPDRARPALLNLLRKMQPADAVDAPTDRQRRE